MKKLKIPFLYVLSFVLSIGPVAIYFCINADRYFVTMSEKIKLTAGLMLLVIITLLKVLGKLKMPSRTGFFGVIFIMCYLLEAVLNDMLIFSFLALVGEVMDSVCQIFIRKAKEDKLTSRAAEKTAEEIKRVLNGRV